ncbi:MAG: hypothetical protein AAB152_01180 [Candidatus Coatesbacteria bacterium]
MGFLGLGCCGLWWPSVGWVTAAAGWWMGRRHRRAWAAKKAAWRPTVVEWLSAAAAAIAVLFVAAASLDLDSAEDALVYHLSLPLRFAADHRVMGLPGVLHASFPQGGPMLYGWLVLLGGEPAVRAWRPWLVLGLCALVWRLCTREGRPDAGWLAAGLVATLPYTFWLGPATMPDLECAGLLVAAALALRAGAGFRRAAAAPALSMTLAAAACAIKYQALFAAPALALASCGWRLRGRRFAIASVLVLAALAPWWWRNAAATGNPVFPYAARVFPSFVPQPPSAGARIDFFNRSYLISRPAELPLLPWRISTVGRGAPLGPLFVLGAPLLLLVRPLGAAAFSAAVAGVALACWVPFSHNPRYALAAWLLLAAAIALSVGDAVAGRQTRRRVLGMTALAACLVLAVAGLARAWVATGPRVASYLTGRDSPAARWDRTTPFPFAAASAALDRVASPQSRVLVVGDIYGAYWGRPTVWSTRFDVPVAETILRTSRTGAEAAKRFRQIAPYIYLSDPAAGSVAFGWTSGNFSFSAREAGVATVVWARWMDSVATGPTGNIWRVRRSRAGMVSRVPIPLVFRPEAFRRAYGPWTSISWDGAGVRTRTVAPR